MSLAGRESPPEIPPFFPIPTDSVQCAAQDSMPGPKCGKPVSIGTSAPKSRPSRLPQCPTWNIDSVKSVCQWMVSSDSSVASSGSQASRAKSSTRHRLRVECAEKTVGFEIERREPRLLASRTFTSIPHDIDSVHCAPKDGIVGFKCGGRPYTRPIAPGNTSRPVLAFGIARDSEDRWPCCKSKSPVRDRWPDRV